MLPQKQAPKTSPENNCLRYTPSDSGMFTHPPVSCTRESHARGWAQSPRKADIGSTRNVRRAGIALAARTTISSSTAPAMWVVASRVETPKTSRARAWPVASQAVGAGAAGGPGRRSIDTVIGPAPKRATIHIIPGAARLTIIT